MSAAPQSTLEPVVEPQLRRVVEFASKSAKAIKEVPVSRHQLLGSEKKAEEFQARTVKALEMLAKGEIKPLFLRKQIFPEQFTTTAYLDEGRSRIQILEKNGEIEVSLLAVRCAKEVAEKHPQSIVDDMPCTTYKFNPYAMNKVREAFINQNVLFGTGTADSKEGTQGVIILGTQRLMTALAVQKQELPPQPIRDLEAERTAERLKAAHLLALKNIAGVIGLEKFNSNQSRIWKLPGTVGADIENEIRLVLFEPSRAEYLAKRVFGLVRYQTLIRTAGYAIVITENRAKSTASVQVYDKTFDPQHAERTPPHFDIACDIGESQHGRILAASFLIGSLK